MSIPAKDYSNALTRVVLTLSMTVMVGIIGTVAWMFIVPDVSEASFAAFFGGIILTVILLSIECVVFAIIYRKQRWLAVGLVSTPILLALTYLGFIKLLEFGS